MSTCIVEYCQELYLSISSAALHLIYDHLDLQYKHFLAKKYIQATLSWRNVYQLQGLAPPTEKLKLVKDESFLVHHGKYKTAWLLSLHRPYISSFVTTTWAQKRFCSFDNFNYQNCHCHFGNFSPNFSREIQIKVNNQPILNFVSYQWVTTHKTLAHQDAFTWPLWHSHNKTDNNSVELNMNQKNEEGRAGKETHRNTIKPQTNT